MCGLFGFIGHEGGTPSIATLRTLARITEQRGRHAFGFAWIDADHGRMHCYKQAGPITDDLGLLDRLSRASALIAHCRYATTGEPEEIANNHPHPVDGGWLVHNGTLLNLASVLKRYDLNLSSECDSEALCQLIEYRNGSLLKRVHEAVGITVGRCAIAAIWKGPTRIAISRRGKPLHYSETKRGLYFASLPTGLPGKRPRPFPDGKSHLVTLRKNGPHRITTEF